MTDGMPHNVFITLQISYFPHVFLGIIHTIWGGLSVMRFCRNVSGICIAIREPVPQQPRPRSNIGFSANRL